jgi:hypothetical protein
MQTRRESFIVCLLSVISASCRFRNVGRSYVIAVIICGTVMHIAAFCRNLLHCTHTIKYRQIQRSHILHISTLRVWHVSIHTESSSRKMYRIIKHKPSCMLYECLVRSHYFQVYYYAVSGSVVSDGILLYVFLFTRWHNGMIQQNFVPLCTSKILWWESRGIPPCVIWVPPPSGVVTD